MQPVPHCSTATRRDFQPASTSGNKQGKSLVSPFRDSPIYVSERSARNLWQDYRVFPDRVELQCWMLLRTFVIPAEDILDVEVRPPLSIRDISPEKVRLKRHWWALKLDWSDFCEHVEIHRKSGVLKYIRFTPDDPESFVAACTSTTAARS
jgi:hypothetical protein